MTDVMEGRPIFKQALGEGWDRLSPVIRNHYSSLPYTEHQVVTEGTMERISHSLYGKLFIPFIWLIGALVPHRGENVPIEVVTATRTGESALHWRRTFRFPGKHPFVFRSRSQYSGANELLEFVRFGIGLRMKIAEKDGGIVFHDARYIWRIFGQMIPLPVSLLIGKIHIEEMPISETEFRMAMKTIHPWFGRTFAYNGEFRLVEDDAPL